MKKNIFKNKAIWITGASSGIGEALTYALHEQSANLIISARNIRRLENVKSNCTKTNSDVHVLPLDLSDLESINIKVEIALKYYGKIDYMIHNAGIALRDLAINTDLRVDQTIMAINYFGPIAINLLKSDFWIGTRVILLSNKQKHSLSSGGYHGNPPASKTRTD